MGISYAVNDLSVSLNSSTTEIEGSSDKTHWVFQLIIIGSMTLSANHNSVENVGGTTGKDDLDML